MVEHLTAPATRNWESVFKTWASGPSATEEERCRNAAAGIQKAIDESPELKHRNVHAFVQGSFKNRVNISQGSDIDVGVVCQQTFYVDIPRGTTKADFGLADSDYTFSQFKDEVVEALRNRFSDGQVTRGDKSVKLRGNTYRIEADVVPFFEYREYSLAKSWQQGVKLIPDSGGVVINWPEQHFRNGLVKHEGRTRYRYRKLVRIVKRLAKEMGERGYTVAADFPGFLLECAVYNVPDGMFGGETLTDDVHDVIGHIYWGTRVEDTCAGWTEVNDIKPLFARWQPWSRERVHEFAQAARSYTGLK